MTDRVVGVLNDVMIKDYIKRGLIVAPHYNEQWTKQVQPASMDLTLGKAIMRLRASFLPGVGREVGSHFQTFAQYEREFSNSGYVIEPGVTYLVPLQESLFLPNNIEASFNPKSTTGRLDIFVRIIGDGAIEFDKLPLGYKGPLYAEITSATFPIKLREGDSLVQMRLRQRGRLVGGNDFQDADSCGQKIQVTGLDMMRHTLVNTPQANFDEHHNLILSASVVGLHHIPVAYKARSHTPVIDLQKLDNYKPHEFWEPIYNPFKDYIILDPNACYILASSEYVRIPVQYSAEMTSYESGFGEFRAHYAGFFDPGFGDLSGTPAAQAVLELRTHSVPFALRQQQPVTKLRFEYMLDEPEKPYGDKSNYQHQGLALAKQFRSSKIPT